MTQDVALPNNTQKFLKKSQDFRILREGRRVQLCMRARSFAILMAAFVGAFALLATPAEAGGKRHYKNYYNGGYYRGGGYGGGYGYYRPYYRGYGYYRPVRYYRPAYYYPGPFFGPAFSIGFSFGGGGYGGGYCR
jgi:hypothetical protein